MSRFDPKNREEAFVYQFEDDVKRLHSMALLSKKDFVKQLSVLQARIDAYNDKGLQEMCQKAEEKHKSQVAYMQKKFPSLGY